MLNDIAAAAVTAGSAVDKAFAGEAQKQARLAAAFADTSSQISALSTSAQAAGGNMTAAFSAQAGQLQAIGAAAAGAKAEVAGLGAASAGGGTVSAPTIAAGVAPGAGGVQAFAAEAGAAISGFVRDASAQLRAFGAAAQTVGRTLTTVLTLPIAAVGIAALKIAGDFEQGMAIMRTGLGLTGAQMAQVSEISTRLGKDITLPKASAEDARAALAELMKSGVSLNDGMTALRPTLQFASVAMVSNKEAADIAAAALNAFHLPGTQAAEVLDLIYGASLRSKASVEQLSEGLSKAAPIAMMLHQPIQDVTTAIVQMTRAGMSGTEAGTAYSTMMMRLAAPTAKAKDEMEALGIHVRDAAGHFKSVPAIIAELNRAFGPTATTVKAVGGDIDEMDKALAKAEKTFKTAQKTIADMPSTLALESAHLNDLTHQLANVDEPQRHLTETINEQKARLSELTDEMVKHNRDGLDHLARYNEDAKGRIKATNQELIVQGNNLAKLRREMADLQAGQFDGADNGAAIQEKKLEIIQLTNSMRENRENLVDWKKEIVDNDRQLKEGLDSTKQKQLAINNLSTSITENVKKQQDWNQAGRDAKVADINAAIAKTTQEMGDNSAKLKEAMGAQDALTKAKENARRVTVLMTDEEKNAAEQTIFGMRGIRAAVTEMGLGGVAAFKALEAQIDRHGVVNATATARQKTFNGSLDGMLTNLRNAALELGQALLPRMTGYVRALSDAVPRMSEFIKQHGEMIVRVAGLAAAAGPALLVIGGMAAIAGRLAMLFTPVGLAITAVSVALAGLAFAWTTDLGGIREKTAAFVATVQKAFADFATWIMPYLKQAWAVVSKDFLTAWGAIQKFAIEIWPQIKTVMADFTAFVKAHWSEISAVIGAAWGVIKGVVQTSWALVSGIIKIGLDVLRGDWGKAWTDIGAMIKGAWDGYVETCKGAGVLLFNAIKAIGSGIVDIFKGMFTDWLGMWQGWGAQMDLEAGRIAVGIIDGLVNGIAGGTVKVAQVIAQLAASITDTIKNLLGIASPSTVMFEVGQNTGQGLADGILSKELAVQSAIQKLHDAVRGGEKIFIDDVRYAAIDAQLLEIAQMQSKLSPAIKVPNDLDLGVGVSTYAGALPNGRDGQNAQVNSGSSTGSGHFLGSEYQTGQQASSMVSGVLDAAFKPLGDIITNAQSAMMDANRAFAADVAQAARMQDAKNGLQIGATNPYNVGDVMAQGFYDNLRKQAASGQYSSINVGGQTINRPGAAGSGAVTANVTINGGVNNAADVASLQTKITTAVANSLRFGT